MKRTAILFLSLSLIVASGCSQKAPDPAQMLAAANALDKKLADAFNNKDADGLMDTLWRSPNLAILDEQKFIVGYETYRADVSPYFKKMKSVKMSFTDTHNMVAGDLVLGQHNWNFETEGLDGTRHVSSGLQNDIKAFRDGKWVYLSITWIKLPPKAPKDERLDDASYNKGDLAGVMSHYWKSDDLAVIDNGKIFQGFDAWNQEIADQIKNKKPNSKFEVTESHSAPFGEVVLGWGKWRFTDNSGDKPVETNGVYTNAKAFKDDKWVIVMDHYARVPN